MANKENNTYRVDTDGFFGELFVPSDDKYPGKALICFSGSDGGIELAKALAEVFISSGLTTLALAYVLEEGLPKQFSCVPIDFLEKAAKKLKNIIILPFCFMHKSVLCKLLLLLLLKNRVKTIMLPLLSPPLM